MWYFSGVIALRLDATAHCAHTGVTLRDSGRERSDRRYAPALQPLPVHSSGTAHGSARIACSFAGNYSNGHKAESAHASAVFSVRAADSLRRPMLALLR